MEGNYSVRSGNRECGNVQVTLQGLYYLFQCRCKIDGDDLYRLWIRCGNTREDLGILVPVGEAFGLEKRLPAKRFGTGIPEFHLQVKGECQNHRFVPIIPEEPFSYISRLKNAYLIYENGQAGILL